MNPNHRRYTPEELARLRELHALDFTYADMARELDRPVGGIAYQVSRMQGRHEITHKRAHLSGRRRAVITERPGDCAIAPRTFGFDPGLIEFLIEMIGLCLEHASTTCECWREMALQWFANRECRGAGLRVTCVGGGA